MVERHSPEISGHTYKERLTRRYFCIRMSENECSAACPHEFLEEYRLCRHIFAGIAGFLCHKCAGHAQFIAVLNTENLRLVAIDDIRDSLAIDAQHSCRQYGILVKVHYQVGICVRYAYRARRLACQIYCCDI